MDFKVKQSGFTDMSAKGTVLASYNQLMELFGSSYSRRWVITTKGHRFAIWLHGADVKDRDEVLPWTIAGTGTGYEVDRCRKITGCPSFTPPDYSELREKYGWHIPVGDIYEELKDLSYGDQINTIYN